MLRIVIVTVALPVATVIIVGKHIIVTAGIIITLIIKDIVTVIVTVIVVIFIVVIVVVVIFIVVIFIVVIVIVVKYVVATVIHRQLGGIVFLLISILHKLFIEQLNVFDSYLIGFAQTIENEG